jgi:N-carbamoyl-L-amino-acid hydrolase
VEVRTAADSPPIGGFVELHIEQGPELDAANRSLAVVRGIAGVRWYSVLVTGRPDHAGAAPLHRRADALREGAVLVTEVARYSEGRDDRLRATVGSITVAPNVPNTVAASARLTIDARSLTERELAQFENWLMSFAAREGSACRVSVEPVMRKAVTRFDRNLVDFATDVVRQGFGAPMQLSSWAFHDSMYLADVCPTMMLFVPSINGVSHTPDEATHEEDLVRGADALGAVLLRLADLPELPSTARV